LGQLKTGCGRALLCNVEADQSLLFYKKLLVIVNLATGVLVAPLSRGATSSSMALFGTRLGQGSMTIMLNRLIKKLQAFRLRFKLLRGGQTLAGLRFLALVHLPRVFFNIQEMEHCFHQHAYLQLLSDV